MKLPLFCLTLLFCTLTFNVYAFNDTITHPDIAKYAVRASGIDSYFKDYLGLTNSQEQSFNNSTAIDIIKLGSQKEDEPSCRASNHFHNPSLSWSESGLTDTLKLVNWYCLKFSSYDPDSVVSNITWATGLLSRDTTDIYDDIRIQNEDDFESARKYFYAYLTGVDFQDTVVAKTAAEREKYMAKSLKALGQTLHLLQDTAVPAHVRNDFSQGHTMIIPGPDWEWIGNGFELHVKRSKYKEWYDSSIRSTMTDVFLSDFWDTTEGMGIDLTIGSTEMGLAEYTNINFFSEYTVFEPLLIYPNADYCEIWLDTPSDGIPDIDRKYIRSSIGHPGEQVNHLLVVSSVYDFREKYFPNISSEKLPVGFDTECYNEYAQKLIPRAIGYSADLIDYFFRGTIEILAPDNFLYGIIDGSITSHEFTRIKAKIRNTTPDEEMKTGSLVAVAKYKKRTDYEEDLSNDPPLSMSREKDYSYSVSKQIDIDSLSNDTPEPKTFDFTDDPIPAGITDLYLQVVFKGTLGNEQDIAVAVGMKDLMEPTHVTTWNATDRVYVNDDVVTNKPYGILVTGQEIRDKANLFEAADFNGNGILNEVSEDEIYIDSHLITETLGFYPEDGSFNEYQVSFVDLPPGQYGKVILLIDEPSFTMQVQTFSSIPSVDKESTFSLSAAVNQENDQGVFQNTEIQPFRQMSQHLWSGWGWYLGDLSGIDAADWPAPADEIPFPAFEIKP